MEFKIEEETLKKSLFGGALALMTFLVPMILAEAGIRLGASRLMIYDMEMYKYAKELKRPSPIASLGHEHIPNASAHLMGVDVSLNDLGFRDREVAPLKKNEYRILAVGSSITMGWGVDFESVFTEVLERRLSESGIFGKGTRVEVVNSGIGNYNTKLESIAFPGHFSQVEPDLVILHYFLRDAEEIPPKRQGFLLSRSYFAAFIYLRWQQAVSRVKEVRIGDYYRGLYNDESKGWKDAQEAVLEMRRISRSKGAEFMVVVQPDLHDFSVNSPQSECHEIIKGFLSNNGIPFVDLLGRFRAEIKDPAKVWVSPDDAHPNAHGHRLISDGIYEALRKTKQGR